MSEVFYKPGLIFFSKNAGYQQIITRDHEYDRYPDGSMEIRKRQLVADFADSSAGGSFDTGQIIDGQHIVKHNVQGGVFDLDETASRLGWTDEDRETAARVMLKLDANPAFHDFQLAPGPSAPEKPWAKYDDTHHFKIASLAEDLGLVGETLAYEVANKNRAGVVKALEEKLATADDESLAAV